MQFDLLQTLGVTDTKNIDIEAIEEKFEKDLEEVAVSMNALTAFSNLVAATDKLVSQEHAIDTETATAFNESAVALAEIAGLDLEEKSDKDNDGDNDNSKEGDKDKDGKKLGLVKKVLSKLVEISVTAILKVIEFIGKIIDYVKRFFHSLGRGIEEVKMWTLDKIKGNARAKKLAFFLDTTGLNVDDVVKEIITINQKAYLKIKSIVDLATKLDDVFSGLSDSDINKLIEKVNKISEEANNINIVKIDELKSKFKLKTKEEISDVYAVALTSDYNIAVRYTVIKKQKIGDIEVDVASSLKYTKLSVDGDYSKFKEKDDKEIEKIIEERIVSRKDKLSTILFTANKDIVKINKELEESNKTLSKLKDSLKSKLEKVAVENSKDMGAGSLGLINSLINFIVSTLTNFNAMKGYIAKEIAVTIHNVNIDVKESGNDDDKKEEK